MKILLLLSVLVVISWTACTGSLFWNPLNNACVNVCPWTAPNLYYADLSSNSCVKTCPSTPSRYANDFTQSCEPTCPWVAGNYTYYDDYYRRCTLGNPYSDTECPSNPSYYAYNATTYGSCVKYCPTSLYARDSTRKCETTCPNFYFVNNTGNYTVRMCVATCPNSTFVDSSNFCVRAISKTIRYSDCPNGEYGDPINKICTSNCPGTTTIKMFADTNVNVKMCVYVCPLGYYAEATPSRKCVTTCTTGFINDVTRECVSICPPGTFSETSPVAKCVTKCSGGLYAYNSSTPFCTTSCLVGTFSDPTTYRCVASCPPGYFADSTASTYVCRQTCSNTSEFGHPLSRTCVPVSGCTSPYVYADGTSRQCVTACPASASTFGHNTSWTCSLTCTGSFPLKDPSTRTCVANCPANPSLYADSLVSGSCVYVCPTIYYAKYSTRTCYTACPTDYYAEPVSKKCVSRCPTDPKLTYFSSGSCVETCPSGTKADPTTLTCISGMCPSNPSYYAEGLMCVTNCSAGLFANEATRTCDNGCTGLFWADNSTRRCVSVCPTSPSLFSQDSPNICVDECQPGWFSDNSTRKCVQSCNSSVGYYAHTPLKKCVLICPTGFYNYAGNYTCVYVCPNITGNQHFIDNTTRSCVTSCPDYYVKHLTLGKCVQTCYPMYTDESIRTCVATCNSTLSLYRDDTTWKCVYICPLNTFGDYSDPADKKCVSVCPPGWYSDNSTWTCVQNCPSIPSYYKDTTLGMCVFTCRAEIDEFALDVGRICVTDCPSGYYADNSTRRCLMDCLIVPSTYRFNYTAAVSPNSTCVQQCPLGYFGDNSTRDCVNPCPSNPDYYGDYLSRLCVTSCPETSTTIYYADGFSATRLCVDLCPTVPGVIGMTYRDKLSRRCVSVNLCTGYQFSDNSTGDCVKKCPSPMFGYLPIKQCVEDCSRANDTYAYNETRLCLKTCPVGKFADNDTQTCVTKCPTAPTIPTTQATFGDRTTNRCVHQCPDTPAFLFGDNATQYCVSRCPGYTYGRVDTRVCYVPLNCTPGTFADPFTKRCVAHCPPTQGTYANNGTQKCYTGCTGSLFADNSSWACVSRCNSTPPYYGYLNKCLAACPNNTYADNNTQTCVPLCPDTAPFITYADPTSQKCVTVCPFDYYADKRAGFRICVQMCPYGWYADDSTKECVVECPLSNKTYGENVTNRCVPICPNGTFGYNSTRICRDICPSPSFADPSVHVCVVTCAAVPNLYGDSFSNTCVLKCPVDQNTFADNSTRLCVPNCPASDQTFADPLTQRCVKTCPVSAITYADNETRSCVGINDCRYNGTYKSYSDNSTLRCVTGCPDIPAYFADDLSHRCVALCPYNITYAYNVSRKCLPICPAGQFLYADPTLYTCVPVCPGGYFADNHTQTCVLRCSYIAGVIDSFGYHSNRTCLTGCPTGWYAQNSTRYCVQNCPKDEYADTTLLRCVLYCDKSKPEYADNTTNMCVPVCPTRPDMFNYNGTRFICVLHCPPGLWASDHNRSCVPQCPNSPAYWSDNSTGRCVAQCPFSLFTYAENVSRTCTLNCPYYTLGDVRNTFADDSTKTCVTMCPSDPWTYSDNSTKRCVFRCPGNSWGYNTTRKCVENCSSYGFSDDTTNFCVAVCPNGYFAENSTSACIEECPSGSFADNSSWICVATCPVNPALYADVTNQRCVVTCANDYYGDDSTQTCVQSCTDPQYFAYDPTKRCIRDCLYPYFGEIATKKCVQNCVPGMYKNMTTHLCTACPSTCRTCYGYLLCLTCITLANFNYYLYNGTCLTGCTSGAPPCASACPATTLSGTITYANPLSQSCVETCPLNYYGLNTTQYCVQNCPINYFASTVTQRCYLCVNGCNNCTNATYCFSCYPGYLFSNNLCIQQCSSTLTFYYNGACVAACPDGTYLMSDQITCNNCSSKCATCSVSATNCIRCVGAFLYNNDCVSKCPTNYYSDANLICQPCTSSTPQCNVDPLTYTLKTFNQNNELYGILTFNRYVVLNISQIKSIINITLKGIPSNSYSWDAVRINSTSFRININTTVSITEETLDTTTNGQMEYQPSDSLDEITIVLDILQPNAITDDSGNVVQTSTAETSLPSYDYIPPEVIQSSSSIATFAKGLAWFALAILLVLMLKGSYPMLFVLEVFQIVYFHAFILASLPYNFQTFVGNLSVLNFSFLPNVFKIAVVPSDHTSSATPLQYKTLIGEITFMVSAGQYFTLLMIYLVIAIIFAILKEKVFKFCYRIRMFAKRQYLLRFKYGAVNEFIWFSFMTFGFFSMFQMKDLKATEPWMYGNLVLSFLCFVIFLSFPVFTIWKALKYRKDMSKLPKKFAFLQGDQSFIPYQIPLRYFRKLLLCCFLVIGTIEIQVPCMIASNFLMLAFYLFFKPSKSSFTNWINILVEVCYLGLEIMLMIFANDTGMSTDMKLTYGKGMIGFALVAILLALIWTVWQFLLFLYEWKLIRDIILYAQLANKIYPEEDNLKVDLEKDYLEEEKVLSESNSILNPIKERRSDDGNILGIEQQFNDTDKFVVYGKDKNEKAELEKEGLGVFPNKKKNIMVAQNVYEEIDSSVDLRMNSSSGFEEVNKPLRAIKKSNDKKVSKNKPQKKNAPEVRKQMWNDVDLEYF